MSNSRWKVTIFNHLLIIFEIIFDTCTFICMPKIQKMQNFSHSFASSHSVRNYLNHINDITFKSKTAIFEFALLDITRRLTFIS